MGPDREQADGGIEGIVERHGDEVADELVKTIRTTRRIGVVVFVVVGVVFLAVAGLIIWMLASGGPDAGPSFP